MISACDHSVTRSPALGIQECARCGIALSVGASTCNAPGEDGRTCSRISGHQPPHGDYRGNWDCDLRPVSQAPPAPKPRAGANGNGQTPRPMPAVEVPAPIAQAAVEAIRAREASELEQLRAQVKALEGYKAAYERLTVAIENTLDAEREAMKS